MKSKRRSPIWPYLAILACLFVLTSRLPEPGSGWGVIGAQPALLLT